MSWQFRYLVKIRGNRDRQLIISGSILAMICVGLCINLTIILTKDSNGNETSIDNGTTIYFYNITSTSLLYTSSSKKTSINTTPFTLPVTSVHERGILINRSLPEPIIYENVGLPLNNMIYYTYILFSPIYGFVTSISIRLFNDWKGSASLYIFVLHIETDISTIVHRYGVIPQRDTIEWQIIDIPLGALPIYLGSILAIGMQEAGDALNEIYAIKNGYSLRGESINENTVNFIPTTNDLGVPALAYTIRNITTI